MDRPIQLAESRVPADGPAGGRYVVHGLAVEVDNRIPSLNHALEQALGCFSEAHLPPGFTPVRGEVREYDAATVLRQLPSNAIAMGSPRHSGQRCCFGELFQDGERFWSIDDRWGLTEINFLRGTWRSWVVPERRLDAMACAEQAVLWPMAQLLRSRGVSLAPGISMTRDGHGVLLIGGSWMQEHARALLRAGYKLIGQRWTALREEEGRVAMLAMPMPMEPAAGMRLHARAPLRRAPSGAPATMETARWGWMDLSAELLGVQRQHAFCDTVLLIEPGRRAKAHALQISQADAPQRLRQRWPIQELHPQRRHGPLQTHLARSSTTWQIQLSQDAGDLPLLLQSLRAGSRGPQAYPNRLSVDVPPVNTTPLGRIGPLIRKAG